MRSACCRQEVKLSNNHLRRILQSEASNKNPNPFRTRFFATSNRLLVAKRLALALPYRPKKLTKIMA